MLVAAYKERYESILLPAAKNLEGRLQTRLRGAERIERITARAKGIDSFLKKAAKKNGNRRKYTDPVTQITDQLAARIIVLFRDDIDPIADLVLKYFEKAEETRKEPESDWEFGYFGTHLLLPVPIEVLPNGVEASQAPSLFELQIRTLFQHAWSETNHDLGYKPESPLSPDETRKLAFTSAQAWGADQIFNELHLKRREK